MCSSSASNLAPPWVWRHSQGLKTPNCTGGIKDCVAHSVSSTICLMSNQFCGYGKGPAAHFASSSQQSLGCLDCLLGMRPNKQPTDTPKCAALQQAGGALHGCVRGAGRHRPSRVINTVDDDDNTCTRLRSPRNLVEVAAVGGAGCGRGGGEARGADNDNRVPCTERKRLIAHL